MFDLCFNIIFLFDLSDYLIIEKNKALLKSLYFKICFTNSSIFF